MRLALLCGLVAALAASGVATASPSIRYGIQDDAWIADGSGTLTQRLDRLQALGVQIEPLRERPAPVGDQIGRAHV